MATGIVSLAAELQSFHRISAALFIINLAPFPVLWVLALARLVCEPAAVVGELVRHQTGPGLLTIVAGTAIIGDQFAVLSSGLRGWPVMN